MTTRRKLWEPVPGISTHILTKRMTELNEARKNYGSISTHILTKRMTIFNISKLCCAVISTHILTKRMTTSLVSYGGSGNISTHILTKRMTYSSDCTCNLWHFNSHPHEEDDLVSMLIHNRLRYFNSHPHEEDDFNIAMSKIHLIIFQLTSSRRGWHRKLPHLHSNPDISTHILTKRMTRFLNTTSCAYNISTHILTKRMTLTGYQHVPDRYFNSHPHEEDDMKIQACFGS